MPSDKDRLDWLQERQETVYRCTHQERRPTTDTFRHYETVLVFDGWAVLSDQQPRATIREAIDFAMGGEKDGGGVDGSRELRAALEQCRNALLAVGGISHVPMARDAVDAANAALGVPFTSLPAHTNGE